MRAGKEERLFSRFTPPTILVFYVSRPVSFCPSWRID